MHNFKKMAFILIKPPSKVISKHRINNQAEYEQLLDEAESKNLCVYSAEIIKKSGILTAVLPWRLEQSFHQSGIDSVYDTHRAIEKLTEKQEELEELKVDLKEDLKTGITCPHCGQTFRSTSGRTLHIKSKHPDKL